MYSQQLITDLTAERARLSDEIAHIDTLLAFASNAPEIALNKENGLVILNEKVPYRLSDSYPLKFAALLKYISRFASIKELTALLNSFEPNTAYEEIKAALGNAKTILIKEKAIVKLQIGTNNSNCFYGSPNWLDAENKPLPEYMYNEDAITIKKTIMI